MTAHPLPSLVRRSRLALAAAALVAAFITVAEMPRIAPVPAAAFTA